MVLAIVQLLFPSYLWHHIFASSNCWGRRPFLLRHAFNPTDLMLLGDDVDDDDDDVDAPPWPSWEDVVEIAADEDSESR